MDVDDAFSHSDSYIQQCELLFSPEEIMNLQYRMILDYTARVERLHLGKHPTKLTVDVANYIQQTDHGRENRRRVVPQPPISLPKIQGRDGRKPDGLHPERKNGGSQTLPPLFG